MLSKELLSLPIDSYIPSILEKYNTNLNLILTAPPGTGKTLRVPAALLKKLKLLNSNKKIVVLVPKRIAALSAAARISEENDWHLGEDVGYQVRFEQKFTERTQLLFMTEGVFVKRMGSKAFFDSIDTVVFDEFHERSSLNDIAFGYCYEQQLLAEKNQQIKILVMSATLESQKLEKFLDQVATIDIKFKTFPLEIVKSTKAQRLIFDFNLVEQIVDTVKLAYRKQKKDILVFLPGLGEIKQVFNKLNNLFPELQLEILHGSIDLEQQSKILKPSDHRRIILSTNIAESSLTLPSVDCVIDTGLEKTSVYEKKIGFQRLELKRISLFSATQRAGRAARVAPGICYQLWHESDERSMPTQIEPEIIKSSLLEETLILASIGYTHSENFTWLDKPLASAISVKQKLNGWNLINEEGVITEFGRLVQKCPLSIEHSLLFVSLCQWGFKEEAATFLGFLETTTFSKLNQFVPLEEIDLNFQGKKIANQLQKFSNEIQSKDVGTDFKTALIKLFLKNFPEKMAQKKEQKLGISSLGRGVQFLDHLVQKDSDYFLLLNGRDINDSVTQIDYAISFSQKEFTELCLTEQRIETDYILDYERKIIYKQQKKLSGYFTLSTSSKAEINSKTDSHVFKKILAEKIEELIEHHPASNAYFKKIKFLKRKSLVLGYNEVQFNFLAELATKVLEFSQQTIQSLSEFMNYDLFSTLVFLTPEPIKSDLQKLKNTYELSSGKSVEINYESENAPLISVRLQEMLGILKTPSLLNEKLRMTIELLAPNYRPTQITNDLENFWKNSYQDVRKDLRARYPKHDWPENPLEWHPSMSKRKK